MQLLTRYCVEYYLQCLITMFLRIGLLEANFGFDVWCKT